MRAFVTGGTGFVGSHLVEALLARGDDVRCLVRSSPKWLEGMSAAVVQGDLSDEHVLAEGMDGAEIVYHVAGMTRAPEARALVEANVEGTRRVLDAAEASGVGRVLVTSSLAAVGPSGAEPLTELAPLRPISAYGESKAAMEQMVAVRRAEGRGPEVVLVRPTAVYGPREADIYTVIKAADRQRVFPIVGDPDVPALDLVHVRDLVDGMIAAAGADGAAGELYFLGGPHGSAWAEIRDAILKALGHGALTVRVPRVLVGPVGTVAEGIGRLFGKYPPLNREKAREAKAQWLVSSEKAASGFGYAPRIGLEEGMAETVAWYRAHGWL